MGGRREEINYSFFFSNISSRLKIACWNVQGLKPWKATDGDFIEYLKRNDIIFLIATCVLRDFRLDIEGFHFYLKPRRSAAGKDVSLGGIAILVRSELRKSKPVRILEDKSNHECDILWIKLDKKFFKRENETFVGGIYIPPANSDYLKFNNIDMFSILDKDIAHFNSLGNVITCGDFNSRTGS